MNNLVTKNSTPFFISPRLPTRRTMISLSKPTTTWRASGVCCVRRADSNPRDFCVVGFNLWRNHEASAEFTAAAPANIYAFSKAIMDNIATRLARENPDWAIVGLRYFNVYGPRKRTRACLRA